MYYVTNLYGDQVLGSKLTYEEAERIVNEYNDHALIHDDNGDIADC